MSRGPYNRKWNLLMQVYKAGSLSEGKVLNFKSWFWLLVYKMLCLQRAVFSPFSYKYLVMFTSLLELLVV